jgi:hypothetical protein
LNESSELVPDPQYNQLPPDIILRPPTFQIPGIAQAPSGWRLRIPPFVFQIYKNFGYAVKARHMPGQQFILLDWTLEPPTWEELIQQENLLPESEKRQLTNEEVKQQVFFIHNFHVDNFFFLWIACDVIILDFYLTVCSIRFLNLKKF